MIYIENQIILIIIVAAAVRVDRNLGCPNSHVVLIRKRKDGLDGLINYR